MTRILPGRVADYLRVTVLAIVVLVSVFPVSGKAAEIETTLFTLSLAGDWCYDTGNNARVVAVRCDGTDAGVLTVMSCAFGDTVGGTSDCRRHPVPKPSHLSIRLARHPERVPRVETTLLREGIVEERVDVEEDAAEGATCALLRRFRTPSGYVFLELRTEQACPAARNLLASVVSSIHWQ